MLISMGKNSFTSAIKALKAAQVEHCKSRSRQAPVPRMTTGIKPKVTMILLLATCIMACLPLGTGAAVRVGLTDEVGTYDESVNYQSAENVHQEAPQQQTEAEGQKNNHPLGATIFHDCAALFPLLYWTSTVQDGVFPIRPESSLDHFDVYCDMTTDGGGWTVIQRRFNGTLNFDRNWADYKNGFGRVEGEHLLGMDKIHKLTSQNNYELYVELEDWDGNFAYAKYSTFSIGDESTGYTLNVGGYSGNAGDSMDYSNGRKFSARDVDNDGWSSTHWAQQDSGGWWYGNHGHSSLNGPYYQPEDYHGSDTGFGIYWFHWKRTHFYSLKATKMMVRPRNFTRKL